ncbi:putative RNA exonuclease 3, partial [Mytilinidion resinicola]
MWPTKCLFPNVPCPEKDTCRLPNCIFSHDAPRSPPTGPRRRGAIGTGSSHPYEHGDLKRRRLDNGTKAPVSADDSPRQPKVEPIPFFGFVMPKPGNGTPRRTINAGAARDNAPPVSKTALQSARRSISPPPTSASRKTAHRPPQPIKDEPKESLMPRDVPKKPAEFTVRRQLIILLHQYLVKLNGEVQKLSGPDHKPLHMTENELIRFALEIEEKIALDQPLVYSNIMKMRIMAYKKMTVVDWVKERHAIRESKNKKDEPTEKKVEPVVTGLSPHEEVMMLERMVARQHGLDAHGYVTKAPTEEEIRTAQAGIDAAHNWEVCDRCTSRFQVYPDRRDDGALTTGGKCIHHWGRKVFPKKEKTDSLRPQPLYSCCNELIGSPGCTVGDTHVFKISEPKRLAAVMQFEETKFNENAKPNTAVCFDCEMGYTCYGLELIRLTATSWPSGEPLIDVLVRPVGAILDLNTRFSGVHPAHFFDAPEYGPEKVSKDPKTLHIVPHPAAARDLLCSYLSVNTPLLGHALENDLNAVRLIHPTIVDTVLLFPHPAGLPIRNGLRRLTKHYLDWDIQQGGAAGHDSLEDARATGELVRFKVKREWKQLQDEGWTVRDGAFYPPLPPEAP